MGPAGRHDRPFVLDAAGTDIQSEAARLRERGAVTLVELPGGVSAWAVTRQEALRRLLADPRVSKDPNLHWPAWTNGGIPDDWRTVPADGPTCAKAWPTRCPSR